MGVPVSNFQAESNYIDVRFITECFDSINSIGPIAVDCQSLSWYQKPSVYIISRGGLDNDTQL